ncbi:response regulator [Polaribacter sp. Q13]|uniref:response regulator n=1 Tax=Polaribacter sp. Q13 TaxID=2806551 RepID=UPI00193C1546|nr:response regulator [Polaribacter sp. Q13]
MSVAKTLQEAISIFKGTNFKLIILDLKLLNGDGIELLRALQENKKDTKVFVFSISTELRKTCFKYGAFAFF